MKRGEYLIQKSDECMTKALSLEGDLRKFYYNASIGFRLRLDELTVQEASEEI